MMTLNELMKIRDAALVAAKEKSEKYLLPIALTRLAMDADYCASLLCAKVDKKKAKAKSSGRGVAEE